MGGDKKIFSHFIITRFNIKAKDWQLDKNKVILNDDTWLIDRINLFETFCLASMIAQVEKQFNWLVYFDINSPEFLKEKIKKWQNECSNLYPIFVQNYEDFLAFDIENSIKNFLDADKSFIITTRIDNDDAFHQDAIKLIQNSFKPIDKCIIDILSGYCLSLEKKILFKRNYISNPFVSYIEDVTKSSKIESVMKEGHPAWEGKVPFITKYSKPMWIQVIHEKNVSNTIKGTIDIKKRNLNDFGIQLPFQLSLIPSVKYKIKTNILMMKHFIKSKLVLIWKMLPFSFRNFIGIRRENKKQKEYYNFFVKNKVKRYIGRHLLNDKKINIIDIGAHSGGFIDEVKAYYKINQALLVEPMSEMSFFLKNKFPSKNFTVYQNAISNKDNEIVEFSVNEFSETSSLLDIKNEMPEWSRINISEIKKEKVELKKLDTIFSEICWDNVDLLKIDVQGAEKFVLEGAHETLKKTKYIWIELSFRPMYENSAIFNDIYQILFDSGFVLLEVSPGFRAPSKELMQGDALFMNNNING